MVIESPSARERDRLIARLGDGDETAREAAIARLIILGPRAVDPLLGLLAHDGRETVRVAALRVLEAIGDGRALEPARTLLADADAPVAVALGAVAVLRRLLSSPRASVADGALDALAALALDPARAETLRLAALEALDDLPPSTRATLAPALVRDPNPRIRARAAGPPAGGAAREGFPVTLEEAAAGRLPARPDRLLPILRRVGPRTAIATLHRLLAAIRAQEAACAPADRTAWLAARGAVHEVLAARGSTVALYDLRDTLATAEEPLPVGFLAALARLGDASCLEPIASAFARATSAGHGWWRGHLASAFSAILRRERLTRRHAVVRRVLRRWPQEAGELLAQRPEKQPRPT